MLDAGYGLAVRWSLGDAPSDIAERLREYVVGTSIARFMFLDGLAFKMWRMVDDAWFEGTYVFESGQARDRFLAEFEPGADESAVSKLVGSGPISIEPYEVVAVAEGPGKFRRGPGPGRA